MSNLSDSDMQIFKILTIGDSGIGKTTFLNRYNSGEFAAGYIATIGVEFQTKIIEWNAKKMKLQLWDTAGQERFRAIASLIYRGIHCFLVMFDLTDATSFGCVRDWINSVIQYDNPIILVGTKADLLHLLDMTITKEKINKIKEEYKIPYFETSSMSGSGIPEVFEKVCELISKKLENENEERSLRAKFIRRQVVLNVPEPIKKSSCCS